MSDWTDAVSVGLGEVRVANDGTRLTVRGIGSCVAVIVHDPERGIGGIAHVVLPSHTLSANQARAGKFADTAVPLLVREMRALGGQRERLAARLVGGASMFKALASPTAVPMGERNILACRTALRAAGIPVTAEAVGGERGRSILFKVADGELIVRMLGEPERRV